MPKGKTPLRSQRLRQSPAITPGWTAASEEFFNEPIQTPSPFKNRVLTRRTSVYVKNIYKTKGIIESRDLTCQKSSGKERNPSRNTRKQTTTKKYAVVGVSPAKAKSSQEKNASVSSMMSKSENLTISRSTSSDANLEKRKSTSPGNSKKQKSKSTENINSKVTMNKRKPTVSPKRSTSSAKQRGSPRMSAKNSNANAKITVSPPEAKSMEKVSSKSTKIVKSKSPKALKPRSITKVPSAAMKMNLSREKTPSSTLKKAATPKVQKEISAKHGKKNSGLESKVVERSTAAVAPLIKKSRTETFSTPEVADEVLSKSKTASVVVKSRTPMAGSPHIVRKTVRITESDKRTPRTPIQRQATPGRLNYRSHGDGSSPALLSVTKKRKMAVTEAQSVTPIKAARILGKVITQKLPKKSKSSTPQTSTPASSGVSNKRPALVVPPVSEIRRSKRTKREVTAEVSTAVDIGSDLSITSLKTPEKKNMAIEVLALKEHSKAVILASENRNTWWGYCNIL